MRDSLQEQKDEFEFTIEDQKDKIDMLTDKNQHVETQSTIVSGKLAET